MKKIFVSFLLTIATIHGASAQLSDGFYHFRNTVTGRYISINDVNPENYQLDLHSGDLNMGGFRTYLNYDTVAVSPSCVIHIRKLDNGQYDFSGQGTSLNSLSSGKFGVNLVSQGGDTYIITGTYQGIQKILADGSPGGKDSWLMNRLTETQKWKALPVNTSDEYIGIRPDVKTADGAYYGTIYAGFNFRLASLGMVAYYVSNAGGAGFTMNEIDGDVIPAGTPVIIRCNSANIEDNKIEPVIGGYTFDRVNWLGGVYCSLDVTKHHNYTLFDRITMRILGLNDKGELAFVSNPAEGRLYNDQFLMANRAYLKVNPSDEDVMTLGGYDAINSVKSDEKNSTGIFTLTGVRLPDGVTPRSGIYILRQRDGTTKKVIRKD